MLHGKQRTHQCLMLWLMTIGSGKQRTHRCSILWLPTILVCWLKPLGHRLKLRSEVKTLQLDKETNSNRNTNQVSSMFVNRYCTPWSCNMSAFYKSSTAIPSLPKQSHGQCTTQFQLSIQHRRNFFPSNLKFTTTHRALIRPKIIHSLCHS
jgi:hypothetical protein